MKITKKQLKRIIAEERSKLQRRETRDFGSNSERQEQLKQSTKNSINEVEYYGNPVDDLMKEVMSLLRSMEPQERNPRIYDIIDELENLAARG